MMTTRTGTLLIFSIHNSENWWRELGRHVGYDRVRLVTDLRGEGDISVVDAFYAAYRPLYRAGAMETRLLSASEIDDVIARCRVLRWYPKRRAAAMALAMAEVMDRVLDNEAPVAVLSWPIDRYVKDVLARTAARRGIPYYELTASPVPGMAMLVLRGRLLAREDAEPAPEEIDAAIHAIADPLFVPSYIPTQTTYTRARFLKTISYFALRSAAFRAISWWKRDPLNLHYMDAQFSLGHKPRLRDIRMLKLIDGDWRARMETFPREKRLFIALQLFPEASIDYWIPALELTDHDEILIAAARTFSEAGYIIVVKDHPLQFGFRQIELIERLRKIPNVIIAPYDVSGNLLLAEVGASFTETGTLGMQAALTGIKSITTRAYYYTPGDYIPLDSKADIPHLPERVAATPVVEDLHARQRRIVTHLLKGSFPGDFMSFREFDAARPNPAVRVLAERLGIEIAARIEAARPAA
jgi:hypothetical protein